MELGLVSVKKIQDVELKQHLHFYTFGEFRAANG